MHSCPHCCMEIYGPLSLDLSDRFRMKLAIDVTPTIATYSTDVFASVIVGLG